jgi:hypothetical protein
MYKVAIILISVLLDCAAIAQSPRTVNNPIVTSGALLNAREVGDPSLTNQKNFSPSPSSGKSSTAALNELNSNGILVYSSGFQMAVLNPSLLYTDTIQLNQVGKIKMIDVRPDQSKVGFLPADNNFKRKGIQSVGLQIQQSPLKWLSQHFINNYVLTDSNNNRQLILVLKKCWFSNNALTIYKSQNADLITTLQFSVDAYTSDGAGYYPQKKTEGAISVAYNKGQAYNTLLDSLLRILKKEVFNNRYAAKETAASMILAADFNEYYNKNKQLITQSATAPKGMYLTYTDFLNGNIYSDSVEVNKKYDNAGRTQLYACEFSVIKNGVPQSCNKAWGYYEENSLYLNTGNGFFIRLMRSGYNFMFFNLNNLNRDYIKSTLMSSITIGESAYSVIREYSRITPLTYQLDPYTGKIY